MSQNKWGHLTRTQICWQKSSQIVQVQLILSSGKSRFHQNLDQQGCTHPQIWGADSYHARKQVCSLLLHNYTVHDKPKELYYPLESGMTLNFSDRGRNLKTSEHYLSGTGVATQQKTKRWESLTGKENLLVDKVKEKSSYIHHRKEKVKHVSK